MVYCRQIMELHTPLTGHILIRLQDIADILHHIRLLTLQFHLLLVNLTDVEDLVHQILYPLGVVPDGLQFCFHIRIQLLPAQKFIERTHDERQWRADVVSGIDEELHLLFIELLGGIPAPHPSNQS